MTRSGSAAVPLVSRRAGVTTYLCAGGPSRTVVSSTPAAGRPPMSRPSPRSRIRQRPSVVRSSSAPRHSRKPGDLHLVEAFPGRPRLRGRRGRRPRHGVPPARAMVPGRPGGCRGGRRRTGRVAGRGRRAGDGPSTRLAGRRRRALRTCWRRAGSRSVTPLGESIRRRHREPDQAEAQGPLRRGRDVRPPRTGRPRGTHGTARQGRLGSRLSPRPSVERTRSVPSTRGRGRSQG